MFYQSLYQGTGEIQLIVGPMFSGKSTELMRRVRRYEIAQKHVCVINHCSDQRYNNGKAVISSHDFVQKQAIMAPSIEEVLKNNNDLNDFDVVAIDEGQFFPDIDEMTEFLANSGKVVIVAALDGTFARKPFGCIANLISKADTVDKLLAVCYCCGMPAPFSARLSSETAEIVVAGQDKYVAACRKCWNNIEEKKKLIHEEESSDKVETTTVDNSKVNAPVKQIIGDSSTESSDSNSENYFELEKPLAVSV